MKYTTNLNLKKPEESEFYDVNDFNDNADAIDAALMARLKLSGGTMTGQIKMAQDVAISRTVNNASIHITGSQNGNEGACITLFGKSSTDYKGCFAINAADDAGNSKQLIGKPDGTLIWNGNRLLTKVDKSLVLLHANASDLVTSIPKNSDLNNYTTAGTYECVGADFAATYSNTPYTYGNFRLIVINNSGDKTGTQMIIAGNSNKMYIRGFYTSTGTTTFKNWEQIITSNDIATSNTYGLVRAATDTDVLDGDNDEAAITPAVYHDVSDFRHKNTAYSVGDKVECMFNFELFLECTQAGTTASTALDTRNVTHGQVITDGTVKWTVRTHIRSVNNAVADAGGNVTIDIPEPVIASEAEAKAGTNNTKHMTPLRVKQAIDALVDIPTEINSTISITTGTVAHNGTIPLPDGFTREECHYAVWTHQQPDADKSYGGNSYHRTQVNQATGAVICYYNYDNNVRTGTAGYMCIAIKSS